jgi:hypothetical protein
VTTSISPTYEFLDLARAPSETEETVAVARRIARGDPIDEAVASKSVTLPGQSAVKHETNEASASPWP